MNETIFLGGCPVVRPEGIYLDGQRVIRLDPRLSSGVGVGDIGCSGIDLDAWKLKNRVKLYPGQRMRWILARSTDDKASLADIRAQVEVAALSTASASVFRKWFNWVAFAPGDVTETEAGNIDNLRVLGIGTREEMITAGRAAGLVVAQKAEDMPGPISVRSPKIWVLVEFVYRGTQSSMPWPMFDDAIFARKWCPTAAQWGLSVTFVQGKDAAEVPPETSLTNPSTIIPLIPSSAAITQAADNLMSSAAATVDELAAAAKAAAGEAAKTAKTVAIVATVAAVLVGGGLIVYYLPRRRASAPSPPRQALPA
jgi:hypothetical protein